ncbi:MAG TPA: hypothetical protein VMA31_12690 [Bryobacteraceae bacterium]|nr:hypothetical protein [Bryobacteraceae bacterium]
MDWLWALIVVMVLNVALFAGLVALTLGASAWYRGRRARFPNR